ncbi:hypothetical protein GCM10025771_05860 [Niveibacterium umoris]|uniref:PsiF repeat-containing protein n=1 Tax=Niveibacterium umoris TaxID=1193620 RepID=A0A840BSS1_9RHOO|nr:PsiF family protein [Niveibacterium umoris]MBB4013866.1 hypothetical protein [Niveibacterium umoris]
MKHSKLILAVFVSAMAAAVMADEIPQETIDACQKAANAKKLKGEAFSKSVGQCIAAKGNNKAGTTAGGAMPDEKERGCDAQANAKKLTGDARKTFVDQCLATENKAGDSTLNVPAEKKAACDAEASAKKLKGAARNSFVTKCEKG